MFGDFSRFENNPELGVTGVYLSQGSPILDSDWNEQAAALSDWITLVGRMAAGDTFRRIGFEVSPIWKKNEKGEEDKTIPIGLELSRGVAMVAGRVVQTQHKMQFQWNEKDKAFGDSRIMAVELADSIDKLPYLVAVETSERASAVMTAFSGIQPVLRTGIRWKICFTKPVPNFPGEPAKERGNESHYWETAARSLGETRHLTPALKVSWTDDDHRLRRRLAGCALALIECHSAAAGNPVLKVASSPDNCLPVDSKHLKENDPVIGYRAGQCAVLDNLAGRGSTKVFVELEDEQSPFRLAVDLFHGNVITPNALYEATVDPKSQTLKISDFAPTNGVGAQKLHVWDLRIQTLIIPDLSMPLVDEVPQADREGGVRVTPSRDAELLPGDRWYLPMQDGLPPRGDGKELWLPGHRVFRAIAPLKCPVFLKDGVLKTMAGSAATTDSVRLAASAETAPIPAEPAMAPRRFDASFHRLTSALDAARELTRKTACKDLPIRVSYLPLRRWLASVSVHEIADLDLDGFLARIRRSLEVPPEEEHLLAEQASLVLEEASRLAGPLPVETIGSRFA